MIVMKFSEFHGQSCKNQEWIKKNEQRGMKDFQWACILPILHCSLLIERGAVENRGAEPLTFRLPV